MAHLENDRDPLEVLAEQYMERLRRGEHPSVEEYASQHADLADEIRELFPTIAMTERLKARQAQSSDGRATLGAARLERLGDFRIIREIGRGGMGVVFEAEQESLGRRVAVKVLPRQVLVDEKHLKRFEREARIAANLHHTNIVEVFGVGEQDGYHYYVMQYIRGVGLDAVIPRLAEALHRGETPQATPVTRTSASTSDGEVLKATLRQLLGTGPTTGNLSAAFWASVARVGLQAAQALDHAHSQGVLHRDIKPANLLLGPQGTIWLADFGLAKAAQSEEISVSRDVVGTLRYLAPEQFRGNVDPRSDLYSLGLTLYERVALRPAYEETDQSRLIHRITQGPPPPPPSASGLDIPRDLETILLKAINPDPGRRYSSAHAMAEDLRCFLEDRPICARRVGPTERLRRWARRNPALASLTVSTLLLLVIVTVVSSAGYVRTRRALAGEAMERSKAEAIANVAIDALDRAFERLGPIRLSARAHPALEAPHGASVELPSGPILSKETAALLEEMLPFYDRLAQQTGRRDDLGFRTAEATRRVGAIRQRLGQTSEATQAYQRAIALFQEMHSRFPTNSDITLKLAQIQNELGRLSTAQRQFTEARQSHRAALGLLQAGAAEPSAPPALQFEQARTCFFLALRERPLPTRGRRQREEPMPESDEQRSSLAQAVTLLKSLSAKEPVNPEYQHLLALCYLEGAPVGDERGPRTREGDERAIGLLVGLVQAYPSVPDYAYDLSEAYTKLHIPPPPIPPELEGEIEERLAKALALLEELVARHPDVPDFLAFKARVHHKLGSFFQQTGRWPDAEHSFRDAITCQRRLLEQLPDAPYYRVWMATYHLALADALFHRDQSTEARNELEQVTSLLTPLLKERPEMDSLHDLLASAYSQLERACRKTGEKAQADEAALKAQAERTAAQSSR